MSLEAVKASLDCISGKYFNFVAIKERGGSTYPIGIYDFGGTYCRTRLPIYQTFRYPDCSVHFHRYTLVLLSARLYGSRGLFSYNQCMSNTRAMNPINSDTTTLWGALCY
jgi:hypothetical protein